MKEYINGLVSIIIPVFNAEKYIEETIKSCLEQHYENVEIILIDDGSTDNSKKIINRFLSVNNISYYTQVKKGVSTARNLGLDKAKGEFIQFLDADDLLEKDKIDKQVRFLCLNEEFIAVYCDTKYFRKDINNMVLTFKAQKSGFIYNELLNDNFIPIHSILFRRNELRFNNKLTKLEDWDFWLRLSRMGQIKAYDVSNCYVRLHDNNVSNDVSGMLKAQVQVLLYNIDINYDHGSKAIIYYNLFRKKYFLKDKEWINYLLIAIKLDKRNILKAIVLISKSTIKSIMNYNSHVYKKNKWFGYAFIGI